jgi:hypothetical protein
MAKEQRLDSSSVRRKGRGSLRFGLDENAERIFMSKPKVNNILLAM